MLQTIERNAEHLQRVAEDLLADPGAGRGLRVAFTELDLSRLAEDAVHAIQTSATVAGIVLTIDPGEEVPIFGDPTRLHQLLGNLLSNAIKFSPRGPGPRDRRQRGFLRPGAGARRRPRHPRRRTGPALRALYRLASSTEMGVPGTGLAWPSPSPWPRHTRVSSTSSTRRVGRPPSGVSPLGSVRGIGGADRIARLRRPGSPLTGAPTGARRHRHAPPRGARHACPARPRAHGRAPHAVEPGDGGQPVRHDQRCRAFHEVPQRLLDERLGLGVQRRCRLVQDEDLGALRHGLGDGDPLALATGELHAGAPPRRSRTRRAGAPRTRPRQQHRDPLRAHNPALAHTHEPKSPCVAKE